MANQGVSGLMKLGRGEYAVFCMHVDRFVRSDSGAESKPAIFAILKENPQAFLSLAKIEKVNLLCIFICPWQPLPICIECSFCFGYCVYLHPAPERSPRVHHGYPRTKRRDYHNPLSLFSRYRRKRFYGNSELCLYSVDVAPLREVCRRSLIDGSSRLLVAHQL